MKFNGRNLLVTSGLIVVLLLVIIVEISLFISGPKQKYEADIEQVNKQIQTEYKAVHTTGRHVFAYIMYMGEDSNTAYWFNEEGKLMTSREKNTLQMETALAKAQLLYTMADATVSLGYGYDGPIYIVANEQEEVYFDIDTMEKVYYREKG